MHRITLRNMHRRHRAARERAMAQKLADVAQIPVAWASGLLVEEHQVPPSPAEPERAGLMQVLNAPVDGINSTENPSRVAMEQADRKRAAVYLGAMLGADPERLLETVKPVTDPRFDSKDLAVAYVSPPIEGMRYLSSDEIERMSKLHIVLAPETQVLVDKAWEKALTEPETPRDAVPANDASASEPGDEHGSEHGSASVPEVTETVIPAAEITKAEIEDEAEEVEDDEADEDADEDEADEDEDLDEDADEMTEDEIDAIERASDPSPVMSSPVAEAVLRAAMKQTQSKKSAQAPAVPPPVAVVYPPAPTGAKCATCQEPALHHVGYHDYCQRCTPTSLKRKAKGAKA